MPRHARAVDHGSRFTSLAVLVVVWLAGLAAGFYTLLAIAARYGCGSNQHGLACGNGGSAAGGLLLLVVIATVTSVTVVLHGRTPTRALAIGGCGLLALAASAFGAHALLSTI